MATGLQSWLLGSRLYNRTLGHSIKLTRSSPSRLWSNPITSYPDPNGFEYLNKLSSNPPSETVHAIQNQIKEWLLLNNRWTKRIWTTELVSERLTHWLTFYYLICNDGQGVIGKALAAAINRHAHHLFRPRVITGHATHTLKTCRGMILATIYLPDFFKRLEPALKILEEVIGTEILPDGGHVSRNPEKHLEAMSILIQVRQNMIEAKIEVPPFLQQAIDRMAPILKFFIMGDNQLAQFNGGSTNNPDTIKQVFELSGSEAQTASSAPHMGFHRLSAQRTRLIFDVGRPPNQGHAGTFSFEMSVGKNPLVVNCGSSVWQGQLSSALKTTAAHSTVTVADTNSSDLRQDDFNLRRIQNLSVHRREIDGNILVEASHDGYLLKFGLVHERSLFLSNDGFDLRGEDALKAQTITFQPFHIRFHLYPTVRVTLVENRHSALLRLPTGRVWRLQISEGELQLDESIYGSNGITQRTHQLVIKGQHVKQTTLVKWRLARESEV
ncbi:MAG: hypothetical protein CBB68_06370 [Rhodospirillaceae bacterium TMED8]|nr:hypothetical protein [Magnetovibrio sp.]OUT51242.1 MAG: hypothetical protein CBB68_06370 [Rhodospirillaceae bacterium TMED8]